MAYFLPLLPSLSIEPGHFLKIYGKILPCSRLSDTMRFSMLLDYWRIVADPFLSDIHCMTRFFTHALPPPRSSLFSLCLTYQIFLNSPLGKGAWGWGWGGGEATTHADVFWLSVLEGGARLNNAFSSNLPLRLSLFFFSIN